jgi:hypothetical protein
LCVLQVWSCVELGAGACAIFQRQWFIRVHEAGRRRNC